MERLKVTSADQGDRVVISPCGEIDMATAGCLRTELVEAEVDLVRRGAAPVIEIDMSQVTFMDCSGLRVLVPFRWRLMDAGGSLCLTHMPPRVHRVLVPLGLDRLLEAPA
ncbi:STAS domain-containing protein [Nonomuraea sp. NPDC003727]